MANVVIVTSQCYLICESVNYISVNEQRRKEDDWDEDLVGKIVSAMSSKKKSTGKAKLSKKAKNPLYTININFFQPPKSASQSPEQDSVSIFVRGKDKADALYKEIIAQIREQIPDHLYLNGLVEKFLTDSKE